MESATNSLNETSNLCRYCKALLGVEFSSDALGFPVSVFATGGTDRHQDTVIRKIETTESIQETAAGGCVMCLHFVNPCGKQSQHTPTYLGVLMFTSFDREDGFMKYERRLRVDWRGDDPDSCVIVYVVNAFMVSEDGGQVLGQTGHASFDFHPQSYVKQSTDHVQVHPSTDSEVSFSVASGWLDSCSRTHTECQTSLQVTPGTLPTRLLHIPRHEEPRLVLVDKETPAFPYATLSHCWGSHMPLRLMQSNMAELQVQIPTAKLSKTFRDAFEIAKHVGLEYIWVDSLCIIQDSKSDWMTESALMAKVYSNSYCNIAATFAADGARGCFSDRNPETVKPLKLFLDWGPQPGMYFAFPVDYWKHAILAAPLNTRAWVCQETYLSPRNLYFCDNQLHWECSELRANEMFPGGIPVVRGFQNPGGPAPTKDLNPEAHGASSSEGSTSTPAFESARESNFFNLWQNVVNRYSRGRLTYPTDRLIAISGLAHRVIQEHGHYRYLAGSWEKHLAHQLLWEAAAGDAEMRPGTSVGCYIAPSWSWASVNGDINFPHFTPYSDNHDLLIEIQDTHIDLVDENNPYGQVTGGHIQLGGFLAQTGLSWNGVTEQVRCNDTLIGVAYIDGRRALPWQSGVERISSGPNESNWYYLPVQTNSLQEVSVAEGKGKYLPHIKGLVLQATSPRDSLKNEFKRVGMFVINKSPEIFRNLCQVYSEDQGLDHQDDGKLDDWGQKQVITIV